MLDAVVGLMWPEGMAYHTFVGDDVAGARAPDRRDLVYETRDGFMIVATVAHREFAPTVRSYSKTRASLRRLAWSNTPRRGSRSWPTS